MKSLFDEISIQCSRNITRHYSTSFSLGIRFLAKDLRNPIYSIYGFVRLADEIVDSFHGFEQRALLNEFKEDTYRAIENGISLNPVLNSFQEVVKKYQIDKSLIDAFLHSMELDLEKQQYTRSLHDEYIYGSAEVVGLMCLKVFCRGDKALYDSLQFNAKKLGSAFQKINFLRDMKADSVELGRNYFPNVDFSNFCEEKKQVIETEIAQDFADGYAGIIKLPKSARLGVLLAYMYYKLLFKKIKALPSERIMEERIRIPNSRKLAILLGCYIQNNLNLIR
jgi:phytoene/squalene synthetase